MRLLAHGSYYYAHEFYAHAFSFESSFSICEPIYVLIQCVCAVDTGHTPECDGAHVTVCAKCVSMLTTELHAMNKAAAIARCRSFGMDCTAFMSCAKCVPKSTPNQNVKESNSHLAFKFRSPNSLRIDRLRAPKVRCVRHFTINVFKLWSRLRVRQYLNNEISTASRTLANSYGVKILTVTYV